MSMCLCEFGVCECVRVCERVSEVIVCVGMKKMRMEILNRIDK